MMYGIFIIPLIVLFIGLFLFWVSENYNKFDKNDISNQILKVEDILVYQKVTKIHGSNMILLSISLFIINIILLLIVRTNGVETGFPGGIGAIIILIQIVLTSLVSSLSKYISNKKYGNKDVNEIKTFK